MRSIRLIGLVLLGASSAVDLDHTRANARRARAERDRSRELKVSPT